MRGTSVRRTLVPLAVLAGTLVLAGCGDDAVTVEPGSPGVPTSGSPDGPSTAPTPTPTATATAGMPPDGEPLPSDITVVVDGTGSGQATTWSLTCVPPGGTHPDPAAACAAIADAGLATFQPLPPDTICTEIYGGPQTATVSGTIAGTPVTAQLSRQNGCEIGRWDALVPLLGTAGGA